MKRIIALLSLLLLTSCCQVDTSFTPTEAPITGYNFKNMHYPASTSPSLDPNVTLQYYNRRIAKRTGGVRAIDQSSGYSFAFTNDVYEDLTYINNKITITARNTYYPGPQGTTEIILDGQSRMTRKIAVQPYPSSLDTIKYSYTGNQLTQSTTGKYQAEHHISNYYYNSNSNLDSIVTKKYYSGEVMYLKVKETFTNYDTAANPLKSLFIFNETFLRSLSQNNYMKYEMNSYDPDNTLMDHEDRQWNIPYNGNGAINF